MTELYLFRTSYHTFYTLTTLQKLQNAVFVALGDTKLPKREIMRNIIKSANKLTEMTPK
jgi:hypothetical protein